MDVTGSTSAHWRSLIVPEHTPYYNMFCCQPHLLLAKPLPHNIRMGRHSVQDLNGEQLTIDPLEALRIHDRT